MDEFAGLAVFQITVVGILAVAQLVAGLLMLGVYKAFEDRMP